MSRVKHTMELFFNAIVFGISHFCHHDAQSKAQHGCIGQELYDKVPTYSIVEEPEEGLSCVYGHRRSFFSESGSFHGR